MPAPEPPRTPPGAAPDPFNLERFVLAQQETYPNALAEIRVSAPGSVFAQVLARYFYGEPDKATLDRLAHP